MLKALLLLLTWLVATAAATTLSAVRKDALFGSASPPPLAALATMGRGFNALTGQSALAPSFETTFQQGKEWKSPAGVIYSVADQYVLSEVSNSFTITAQGLEAGFAAGAQTYFNAFKAHLGIELGPSAWVGSAAYHHLMKALSTHLSHGHVKYGLSTYRAVEYQLNALPAFALTPAANFTAALAALPDAATSPSDAAAYKGFIATYGTHYVCRGDYGGEIAEIALLAEATVELWGEAKCTNSMTAAFHKKYHNVSSGEHANGTDIHIDDWYLDAVVNISQWRGGDPALRGNNSAIGEWVKTIPDEVGLVGAALCSLGDFMDSHPTRQATFLSVVSQLLGSS